MLNEWYQDKHIKHIIRKRSVVVIVNTIQATSERVIQKVVSDHKYTIRYIEPIFYTDSDKETENQNTADKLYRIFSKYNNLQKSN